MSDSNVVDTKADLVHTVFYLRSCIRGAFIENQLDYLYTLLMHVYAKEVNGSYILDESNILDKVPDAYIDAAVLLIKYHGAVTSNHTEECKALFDELYVKRYEVNDLAFLVNVDLNWKYTCIFN